MEYTGRNNYEEIEFKDLKGQILTQIEVDQINDIIKFYTADDEYWMGHIQDCCESVTIQDICGPIQDLIGSPINLAEERSNGTEKNTYDTCTWTFYEIANKNVSITITWYGTSNGYYSEAVEFYKKKKE